MTTQATGPNLYTEQLARHQRARQALLHTEHRRHLLHNAEQAAFMSLMRAPGAFSSAGVASSPTPPPALTESFERLVTGALEDRPGGRLDFSIRNSLAGKAVAMGLTRFDANLLIARVEHYAGTDRSAAGARRPGPPSAFFRPERWFSWLPRLSRRRIYSWGILGLSLLLVQGVFLLLWIYFLQVP